ncbi:hypothetical protein AgCh_002534 [Apium graveolens]
MNVEHLLNYPEENNAVMDSPTDEEIIETVLNYVANDPKPDDSITIPQDLNNVESDPEEMHESFANIGVKLINLIFSFNVPAIAFAIREQLKADGTGLILMKLHGFRPSVIRKRKEWDAYEPIVDILSIEGVGALEAREERNNEVIVTVQKLSNVWTAN